MKSSSVLVIGAGLVAAFLAVRHFQNQTLADKVKAGDEVEFLNLTGLPPEVAALLNTAQSSAPLRFTVLATDSQSLQVRPKAVPMMQPFMMAKTAVSRAWRSGSELT